MSSKAALLDRTAKTVARAIESAFELPREQLDDAELNARAFALVEDLDELPISEGMRVLDRARLLILSGTHICVGTIACDILESSRQLAERARQE